VADDTSEPVSDQVIEAETMTPSSGAYIKPVADNSASGGSAMAFYSAGTASKSVTTSALSRIVVRARGDQCSGAPILVVNVDGTQVLSTAVTATTWTDYSVNVAIASGTHAITAGFVNDYYPGVCDRNLYVDKLTLGAALTKPSIPAGLTATAGDSQATLTWNANPTSEHVDVYQDYKNDAFDNLSIPCSTSVCSYTVTGLTNGTTYTFRVSAHNSSGYGDWTAPISVAPAPPTVGGRGALGLLRYNADYTAATNKDQYRLVITSVGSNATSAALLPGRSLPYSIAIFAGAESRWGMTLTQARANGWLLHTSTGAEIQNNSYPGNYLMNLCSQSAANAWAQNVASYLGSIPGIDGTFIDNISIDWREFNLSGQPIDPATGQVMTSLAWEDCSKSFYTTALGYLHSLGYYVVGNAGAFRPGDTRSNYSTLTAYWWQKLVDGSGKSLFDGLMDEHWMRPGSGSHPRLYGTGSTGTDWDNRWQDWVDLVNTAQSLGADFVGEDTGASSQVIRYGRASMMLNWDCGDGAYIFSSSGDPWSYGANADLGCPTGAKTQPLTNVYKRVFANGEVIVNPTTAPVTVDGHTIPSGDAYLGT
jgi:hypothetical protein